MQKGLRHMRFATKLYRIRADQGRWFLLHEPPQFSIILENARDAGIDE